MGMYSIKVHRVRCLMSLVSIFLGMWSLGTMLLFDSHSDAIPYTHIAMVSFENSC